MSNIINVKEERNVLSFVGEIFNIVANSSNFYLKFELDSEWDFNKIITVIFNFDGRYEYVELDENRMCQIPPTNSSRIWFCITTEPDDVSRLSSTILSLDVEPSGETNTEHVEAYQYAHANMLGLVQNLLTGNVNAKEAEYASEAGVSRTQVSLTGDEEVAGEKNFVGTIKHNSNIVPDCKEISNPNLIINADFKVNQREKATITRNGEDVYTADRWGLFYGNGKFQVSSHKLTGLDENQPTVFGQWVESSENFIYGETITVSATINDVRYSKTITLPETYEEDYINNVYECDDFVFRIYVNKTQKMLGVQFLVVNGVVIIINKVKLELSNYETKYIERTLAEEMMLCQRYYQKLHVYSTGQASSTDKIMFIVNIVNPLRLVLRYEFRTLPYIVKDGTKTQVPDSIVMNQLCKNGILFVLTGSDYAQYEPYTLVGGILVAEGEYYL